MKVSAINQIFIFFIWLYQKLFSPLLGPRCRFYPTCSSYSRQCFLSFPFHKALWYSVIRLLKCHPFHPGGHDPVPCSDNCKNK